MYIILSIYYIEYNRNTKSLYNYYAFDSKSYNVVRHIISILHCPHHAYLPSYTQSDNIQLFQRLL